MAAHGSVNTMNDSVGKASVTPRHLWLGAGTYPWDARGAQALREGRCLCPRRLCFQGESDLGRELAGVTRSGAVGREPQSPYRTSLRGTRRRAQRRPGWQNRGGSGKARSPLPSTGDNRSGRRHRAPAPALSELGARSHRLAIPP